jgi:hypothetical protein
MLYLALYVPAGELPLSRSVRSQPALALYVQHWGAWPPDRGMIAIVDGVPVGAAWLRLFPASDRQDIEEGCSIPHIFEFGGRAG